MELKRYFHFRFCGQHFELRMSPMSGTVSAVPHLRRTWSKCGGCRWNRVTIAFRSKIISTSGFVAEILSSGCRPISHMLSSAISKPSMVTNVGKPLESRRDRFPFKSYSLFRFVSPPFRVFDVDRRRATSADVRYGGKCGGGS